MKNNSDKLSEIKKAVKIAKELVKDEEEPFKSEAFKVILSKILEESKEITSMKRPLEKGAGKIAINPIDELSKYCSVSPDKVREVVDIANNTVLFIVRLKASEAEKQVIASQCILLAYHVGLGVEWVKATLLREALKNAGIGSLNNLSRNLNKRNDIFRIRGTGKSAEYRLTEAGKNDAMNKIKSLSSGHVLNKYEHRKMIK
jgi:hypothetical protein